MNHGKWNTEGDSKGFVSWYVISDDINYLKPLKNKSHKVHFKKQTSFILYHWYSRYMSNVQYMRNPGISYSSNVTEIDGWKEGHTVGQIAGDPLLTWINLSNHKPTVALTSVIICLVKCGMRLLIYSQTALAVPKKSNFIPHFIKDAIRYRCWDLIKHVGKTALDGYIEGGQYPSASLVVYGQDVYFFTILSM